MQGLINWRLCLSENFESQGLVQYFTQRAYNVADY